MASSPLRTLLLVEERTTLLRLRKALFESIGYAVVTATNLPMALAKLEICTVDAVLLEYRSQGPDALTAASRIKQLYPSLPLIVLTSNSKLPKRVLRLVNEFATKSEPVEALAYLLERVIRSQGETPHKVESSKTLFKVEATPQG